MDIFTEFVRNIYQFSFLKILILLYNNDSNNKNIVLF